jgi:DNA-binding LytR/AlgR family response regulator
MWIGICEDEIEYRTRLEKDVRSLAEPCDRVTSYANGSELLDEIYAADRSIDLLFLDMEMPALSGIETARELLNTSPHTQIVIITKHKDFALKSFEIRPSNYLVKPVDIKQLQTEIDRARLIAEMEVGETLRITAKDSVAFIPHKDILYVECFRYTLHIHTPTAIHKYNHKLSSINETLADKGFCRIHKSILVNLRHVENIDKPSRSASAVMSNGKTLPISEHRITEVLGEYSRYWHSVAPKVAAPACTGAAHGDHSISRSLAGTLG